MKLLSQKDKCGLHLNFELKILISLLLILTAVPCRGKVLFLAHYDNESVNADYAVDVAKAVPAPRSGMELSETAASGRWGGGLDLREPRQRNCTYRAVGNLNPRQGTVDFWYCIDEAGEKYNPIFCWYVHAEESGSQKKVSGFELYRYGNNLIFAIYQPYAETSVAFDMDIGNWHHMEINWDCSGGDGASEYNVYLDGKNVLRMTEAIAFKSGGGFLHPGLWDYAWGGIALRGRLDELRVTDQVEHLGNFTPPEKEYLTPRTAPAIAAVYRQATDGLKHLQQDICNLAKVMELSDEFVLLSNEQIKHSDLSLIELQNRLDEVNDTVKSARLGVVQAMGVLYQQIPERYNEALVNFGLLKDGLDSFKRALFYVKADRAQPIGQRYDKIISTIRDKLQEISETFYNLFGDSEGGKRDPVAAIPSLVADRNKSEILQSIFVTLSDTSRRIEKTQLTINTELQELRSSPRIKERFPDFQEFVPVPLPPLKVEADGTLKRLVYGGTWGRTETMMALGFDTLTETGASVKWVKKDKFDVVESANTLRQWKKYRIPLSDTVFLYAVGDNMYRPEWFAEEYNDNPEYYFRNHETAVGSHGFDYRHPVPRALIVQYLEEAARINGQKPYTFIYKGPWEAHPYTGWSVNIPGKRTTAFKEHGFSSVAVQAFRDYLKGKFTSINLLNAAWKTSYSDFSDVEPPDPLIRAFVITKDERNQDVYSAFFPNKRLPSLPSTGLTYEFERCRKDLYADYLAECYQAIKRGDPTRPLASSTSGGIMDEILINSLDDLQMPQRCVDMWGKHPSGGYGWCDSPYMYGLNRYFNKTLVALEYYGWAQEVIGDDFWPTFKLAKGAQPQDVYHAGRRDTWHEFSWDRRMLLFYWAQKIVELPEGFRAETSPLARSWSNFFAVVKNRTSRINDILFNVPIVEPRIGVLHPGVSIINAYPPNACSKITRDIFDRLLAKQYHAGIVPEKFIVNGRDKLDHYEVIILPYMQYFEDGFGEKLLEWVNRGGTLISAGPFGLYSKYGFDIEYGAAAGFSDVKFSYPPPEEFVLSWQWEGERNGKKITKSYLTASHGQGHILMTLDGRGFGRRDTTSAEAHVGIEIGAEIKGTSADNQEQKKQDDRTRPLKLESKDQLAPAVVAFYELLQDATRRKASVTQGNVEMVLRQKNSSLPWYVSLLNWDYTAGLETEVVVRGEYNNVTDLSIEGGFPIPVTIKNGMTHFNILFGPGEGLMLEMK